MNREVVVMGAGLLGARHFTLETLEAIRSCEVLYHLVNGADLVAALEAMAPRVVSLVPLYEEGLLDLEVYRRITGVVLGAALSARRVGLLVMGHPSIYVAPTHHLVQAGPAHGVSVRVLPALSSIDVMLTSLPFDIATTGLQILDANRLVTYGLAPSRQVPLLLFQVGCFGSGFITRTATNSRDRLRVLHDYLRAFYPAEHPVVILESQMGVPHREVRVPLALRDLAWAGHLVNYNSTLYVPPAEAVSVRHAAFRESLVDPASVPTLLAERSAR